jgi:hypothetical protein
MSLGKVCRAGKAHIVATLLVLVALVMLGLISALGVERFTVSTNTTTPTTITMVIFPNASRITVSEAQVATTPPSIEFRGPVVSEEVLELRVVVYLSNSSVGVNETLWIKVVFEGEKAFFSDYIILYVLNSRGEKVYGTGIVHPHPTPPLRFEPPKRISYILSWRAIKDPHFKVDVTPGNYTLAIEAGGIRMSIPITVTP